MVPKDLQRAKTEDADAVFILADKFCSHMDEEDSNIMLQNLCIRKYLASCNVEGTHALPT